FVDALTRAVRGVPATPAGARHGRPLPALVGIVLATALLVGVGVAAALLLAQDDKPQGAAPGARTVTREVTVQDEPTTVVQTVTSPTEEETSPDAGLSVEEAAALNDEAFGSYMQQGDYEGALPLLERALPVLRGTYRDDFPYEAYAEYNLGKTLVELDRCDEALPHLDRSEELQGHRGPITAARNQCRG
ncbi:MAG: tetratricopeptide repeat protein, partial [Gaiellaceae bacterium]